MSKLTTTLFCFCSALSTTVFADTIITDNYTGTVNFCAYAGGCTQLTQTGLDFSNGVGNSLSLGAGGSPGKFSVDVSFAASPLGYYTGPTFFATETSYYTVTITGGTGHGSVNWFNNAFDACDGTLSIGICGVDRMLGPTTTNSGAGIGQSTFTFGDPFLVEITQTLGVEIQSNVAGGVTANTDLFETVFDSQGNAFGSLANPNLATISFVPASPAPEPSTYILIGLGLFVLVVPKRLRPGG